MKITLNENEMNKIGDYLFALDKNIDEGDYFNDVLHSTIFVKKQKKPFEIVELDPSKYLDNPYYKLIKPSKEKKGDVYLTYDKYLPKQGFVYDEIKLDKKDFREKTPFGYFPSEFPFLALKEKDVTWMSITPHEINTMEEGIKNAKGNVVTLGLGLGYFAFMVSNKEDVKHVKIIETNEKVIDIFKKDILPSFPNKEKIEIIKQDAFVFLSSSFEENYLYADLWHMPEDALPIYTKILQFEETHPNTKFEYWIEKSILALIRRSIIVLLDEEMYESVDANYMQESTLSDHLINQIHFILKNKEIKNIQDVISLLDFPSLKEIAKKIKY